MYNNNGINLLNKVYRADTNYVSYNFAPVDNIVTFTDGTTNGNVALFIYYSSSSLSISEIPVIVQKLTPTQKSANAIVSTIAVPSTFTKTGYFHVGYRATPFTPDTYTDITTISGLSTSVGVTVGVPTITAYNTSASDITVNEVTYLINAGTSQTTAKPVLIAGFHFQDITIAPGETYTFTITHKNG
jgi:hypothetical protein